MDTNMKTLNVNGRELQYKIFSDFSEYHGTYYWTKFYEGVTTKTSKKFLFFGETITTVEPNHVFTIHRNIESIHYTKKEIRELIEVQLALLDREDEIQRGEII